MLYKKTRKWRRQNYKPRRVVAQRKSIFQFVQEMQELARNIREALDRRRNGKWGIFLNGRREWRRRKFRNFKEFSDAIREDLLEGRIPPEVEITVRRIDIDTSGNIHGIGYR